MTTLSSYDAASFKNENDYVIFKVESAIIKEKTSPYIEVKVINKTDQIINIKFSDTFFVSHDKVQYDIRQDSILNAGKVQLLPNVGRRISFSFDILQKISNFSFNKEDLIISSFYLNGSKQAIGFKIGEANIQNGIIKNTNYNIESRNNNPKPHKPINAWLLVIIVIISIVIGFVVLGMITNSLDINKK